VHFEPHHHHQPAGYFDRLVLSGVTWAATKARVVGVFPVVHLPLNYCHLTYYFGVQYGVAVNNSAEETSQACCCRAGAVLCLERGCGVQNKDLIEEPNRSTLKNKNSD
jgi:hypothetical protein